MKLGIQKTRFSNTKSNKIRKNISKRIKINFKALFSNKYCIDCGKIGQCAHHIIPINKDPDIQLDINNLVLLCNICHRKKHPELPDKLFF